MTKEDCVKLFGGPSLFGGWTEAEVFGAIRDTFLADPGKMTMALRPEFKEPKSLAALKRRWAAGSWSFGYCYYIAEAARLIFLSAYPAREFKLRIVKSKKKLGALLPPALKKHFVLFYEDRYFDPELGCAVEQRKYGSNVKGSRFLPQLSVSALLLLAWTVDHYEQTLGPARISLLRLRPALSEVARRWRPGGPKAKLKDEVRRIAGLPPFQSGQQ
jgi:hypothetical protein